MCVLKNTDEFVKRY